MRDNIVFGANLKKLRKKHGYSRESLAEMLSYSPKSIEKWELGCSIPPVEIICRLSMIFKVTVDSLLFEQNTDIKYLLGIDGGGTKTEFLLTDLYQKELRRIILGSSNPVDIGIENCKKVLEQGLVTILDDLNLREVSVFAGLSGGITGNNQLQINKFLSGFGFGRFANGSDTENALEITLHGSDGISVIMGTGIISFCQLGQKRHRIGGWGYLIDRGGSGYNFGVDALDCALKSIDGRNGSPIIKKLIEDRLNQSLPDSISCIYHGGKSYIASFAATVFDAYKMGDSYAEAIIDKNMKEVAQIINAGFAQLHDKKAKVVVCGGLCHFEEILRPFLLKYLDRQCSLSFSCEPMVNGAVTLARKNLETEKK